MAGFLPRGWIGKRVAVNLQGQGGFEANLVSDNAGGVEIESIGDTEGSGNTEDAVIRRLFLPWSAVRYVELLEEERRPASGEPPPST